MVLEMTVPVFGTMTNVITHLEHFAKQRYRPALIIHLNVAHAKNRADLISIFIRGLATNGKVSLRLGMKQNKVVFFNMLI